MTRNHASSALTHIVSCAAESLVTAPDAKLYTLVTRLHVLAVSKGIIQTDSQAASPVELTQPTAQYVQHRRPAVAAKFYITTQAGYARVAMLESGRMANQGRYASNAQPTATSAIQVLLVERVHLNMAIQTGYVQFASKISIGSMGRNLAKFALLDV